MLTGEFTALGVTRMLEAVRLVDPNIRFYQASSSEMFGKVRETPQNEHTAVPPAQSLRRGQGVRPRDHRELPGELRPLCLLRHPVQPRIPAAGARVRHPQGHRRGGPDQVRPGARAAARQPRRPARLGLRRRLRAGHVAHAPAGAAGRLRGGHGREPLGPGAGRAGLLPRRARLARVRGRSTRSSSGRPRWTCWWAMRARRTRRSAGRPRCASASWSG